MKILRLAIDMTMIASGRIFCEIVMSNGTVLLPRISQVADAWCAELDGPGEPERYYSVLGGSPLDAITVMAHARDWEW